MVKKIIILFILLIGGGLIMFTSCNKNSNVNESGNLDAQNESELCDSYVSSENTAYDYDIIPNADVAKQYANIVFKEALKRDLDKYKIVKVSFDSANNIWIVNYWVDEQTLGGDINIEIFKKTGEIKKIWAGE